MNEKKLYFTFFKNFDGPICNFKKKKKIFISGSFIFHKTKEGHDYWVNIDMKWRAYLKKKQDEKKGNIHRELSGAKG